MKKIALIYSFNTVKTRKAAERIANEFGHEHIVMLNAEDVTSKDFLEHDHLILGLPTWFDGELPNYWDEFVPELEDLNLKGKKVALFGLGDQKGYPENFGDALGIMADILEKCGAEIIGFTDSAPYVFETSEALRDEEFCGLMLDQENQPKLSEKRIRDWVKVLKKVFGT